MSYSIKWNPGVFKKIEKFPKPIIERIVKKIESIKENPFHFLEHYEGEDLYKLRIRDYRALIDVDFSNKILKIRVVRHRKNVYKN
ncbi:MAG: type II toxin-antitoxin system RelE/ParE family toxin [Nanoarchaeota archaeon]|nr:type II toxin-antitoxin system RelE/ParE family toxin [Nanoarchaeota archaeon]MBU1623329.1 type II toxin-antitoxin system RelE/ParE family toxin [Nanoarchaeota archaeon]